MWLVNIDPYVMRWYSFTTTVLYATSLLESYCITYDIGPLTYALHMSSVIYTKLL
jgi:hypothetical protein